MKEEKHYGLFTAVSMIVGICVGSGIFFKADDILGATGGNVALGILVFCIGAFSIIFGSITLTQLANRTEKTGGVVAYFEEFISDKAASAFGWFQLFVYLPTITVVVSWVSGIYTCMLLGLPNTLETQTLIGTGYMAFFFLLNYFSLRLGGYFQNLATIMKLIPLIAIAIVGVFWKEPAPIVPPELAVPITNVGWGWLAALAPMACSYDGWTLATNITHEVKNPKRTMPLALTIGPLVVLAIYLPYFSGLVSIAGSEYILAVGDEATTTIGISLLGERGGSIILSFVLIAILGVTNGVIMGMLRLPQALAEKNMLPNSSKVKRIDPKSLLSPAAAQIAFAVSLVWMVLHYLSQKSGILGGGDVSEIAIVFSYMTYVILYLKVISMKKEGVITSSFFGSITPVFAIMGSAIILIGGIVSNPTYVPIFILFCFAVCFIGYKYYEKKITA